MTKAVIFVDVKSMDVGQSEGVSFSFHGETEGITYKKAVLRTLQIKGLLITYMQMACFQTGYSWNVTEVIFRELLVLYFY